MTRGATWTNADGLVVGFGTNSPERNNAGVTEIDGVFKEARLQITYQSGSGGGAGNARITLPAGAAVESVTMKVGTAWVGGTSLAFGDAGNTGGWISAAQGATANLTAGAEIVNGGAYAIGGTDATAKHLEKVYAAATDLFITIVGAYTAGDATIIVVYR